MVEIGNKIVVLVPAGEHGFVGETFGGSSGSSDAEFLASPGILVAPLLVGFLVLIVVVIDEVVDAPSAVFVIYAAATVRDEGTSIVSRVHVETLDKEGPRGDRFGQIHHPGFGVFGTDESRVRPVRLHPAIGIFSVLVVHIEFGVKVKSEEILGLYREAQ